MTTLRQTNQEGYTINRDKNGRTEQQRLNYIKALRQEYQHEIEQGKHVPIDDVIQERRQVAEIISGDLLSLGGRLSAKLLKKISAPAVKKIIDAEVVSMMKRWKEAGNIDESKTDPKKQPGGTKKGRAGIKKSLGRAVKSTVRITGKTRSKVAVRGKKTARKKVAKK